MYVAFSALRQQLNKGCIQKDDEVLNEHESLLRFEAYQAACEKYKDEIIAIQKYMPGWLPAFKR